MAPLLSAVAYALVVFTVWGGGHGAQIAALGLGYLSVIVAGSVFAACIALLYLFWSARRRGETCSPVALARAFVADRWRHDRGASLWQPAAMFVVLMTSFTFFKIIVLPHAGFGYGPAIANLDRALFGADPWRITHAVFASPWWTQAIDLAYHAWFAPLIFGVVLCAFARPGSVLAWRYLLAFCLIWIVQGSILAYGFPAAGPVFFAQFQLEAARFTELTDLLASQDAALRAHGAPGLTALMFQHGLLQLFNDGTVAVGGGISAMPSLHNAMAILFACAAWRLSPRCGWATSIYAAIIWIGSIHLGWHYALDGIVALIVTVALWKLTGLLSHAARPGLSLSWRIPIPAFGLAAARLAIRRRTTDLDDGAR